MKMNRKLVAAALAMVASTVVNAQNATHLDFAVTAGTTGIGAELAMPVGSSVQVRTGFSIMPSVKENLHFNVGLKNDPSKDKDGNKIETKFDKMSNLFEQLTSYKIDRDVTMIGRPKFNNVKLLVDVFPFRNKKWFFTAGVYYGPSEIARAYNSYEDMPSLVGVGMYNHMRDQIVAGKPLVSITAGGTPYEISLDPEDETGAMVIDRFTTYGRMGVKLGEFADGTPYYTEPDENARLKARILTDRFRPYVGFGYGNAIPKTGKLYNFSFECGMMSWGGTPRILTHDGVDLAHDVHNIRGDVGRYVRIFKAFKVYPVINLRISRRLF